MGSKINCFFNGDFTLQLFQIKKIFFGVSDLCIPNFINLNNFRTILLSSYLLAFLSRSSTFLQFKPCSRYRFLFFSETAFLMLADKNLSYGRKRPNEWSHEQGECMLGDGFIHPAANLKAGFEKIRERSF